MNVWKVILVTLVIFSTGAITGGFIGRKTAHSAPEPAAGSEASERREESSRPERWHRRGLVERMQEELHLSPTQARQIEAILSESQDRMRELWKEMSPRMQEEFEATKEEIRQLLTPEQQAAFESVMKKRRGPRRDDEGGKPGGEDPGRPREPLPPPPEH